MSAQPSARTHVADLLGEPPACRYGYPADQLERLLGDKWDQFCYWSRGSTMVLCEGRSYDYETKQYRENGCGPHDVVIYSHDVARFLAGLSQDD